MHDFDGATSPEDPPDRGTREVQAESVTFVVASHYGLDTGGYNFGYVASWASGRELEELKASMGAIPEEGPADREGLERLAAAYLEHFGEGGVTVGFDIVSMMVLGDSRGFLRLHRNALSAL